MFSYNYQSVTNTISRGQQLTDILQPELLAATDRITGGRYARVGIAVRIVTNNDPLYQH
jgi:hypothetical protein